jgi:hypothetical protein
MKYVYNESSVMGMKECTLHSSIELNILKKKTVLSNFYIYKISKVFNLVTPKAGAKHELLFNTHRPVH